MNVGYQKTRTPLALLVLLLVALTAAACSSDRSTDSQNSDTVPTVPAIGSTPKLSAQEILDRAKTAVNAFTSVRSVGGFLSYETDGIEEPASVTMVSEWTAPNRSRQTIKQDQVENTVELQTITIGDRGYILGQFGDPDEWREVKITRGFESEDVATPEPTDPFNNQFGSALDIALDETVEVVRQNDSVAYRIAGNEKLSENDPRSTDGQETVVQVVLLIDTANFLILRDERIINTRRFIFGGPDLGTSNGLREQVEHSIIEMWSDYTYLDEPLVIEPPDEFTPFNTGDDGPDLTPTPFTGSGPSTPTAVPNPNGPPVGPVTPPTPVPFPTTTPGVPVPVATFSAVDTGPESPPITFNTPIPGRDPFHKFEPDDPDRHIPFYLNFVPYYDKLELGDNVVVNYPECNYRNSILDRVYNTAIFYVEDGSRAVSGLSHSPNVDPDNPDAFADTTFFTDEGRLAIEKVLNDPELMSRIIELKDREVRCPAELLSYVGDNFSDLPETDRLIIDEQLVARFESCSTTGVNLAAPILIAHLPSESVVAVTPGSYDDKLIWKKQPPEDRDYLSLALRDGFLRADLAALALRGARCG